MEIGRSILTYDGRFTLDCDLCTSFVPIPYIESSKKSILMSLQMITKLDKVILLCDPTKSHRKYLNNDVFKNIIVDKLEVLYARKLDKIISSFREVKIIFICSWDFSHNTSLELYYKHSSSKNRIVINTQYCIENIYDKFEPTISGIKICVTESNSEHILSAVLSNPVDRINIINVYNCVLDVNLIVDLLLNNPARHIYLKGINITYDHLIKLINKPGILSLRIRLGPILNFTDELFDDNYTILRFYYTYKKNGKEIPQYYLTSGIYFRNLHISENVRFKKTKVIIE